MGSLLVDGRVEGNINVDVVSLRNSAQVFGNITCKSITIDPQVVISGKLNIHPKAPMVVDCDGNEVSDEDAAQVLILSLDPNIFLFSNHVLFTSLLVTLSMKLIFPGCNHIVIH